MVRSARSTEVDVRTLYAILRLRSEVFVVEQECAYLDIDGRDLEAGCVQLWVERDDGAIVATARVLVEGDHRRIGRVCTDPAARGRGIGAAVMDAAIALADGAPIVLDAQSHLVDWYARFGFASTGREFVEDQIPHTEMRRA